MKRSDEETWKACCPMDNIATLILVAVIMLGVLGGVSLIAHMYTLNIKSKTVGNGQHGTARWATKAEIRKTYRHIPFEPELWRQGKHLPKDQGIVVGCTNSKGGTTALIDTGDVHALMIGAAGVGKTAYWLYPCIEYACASGMSFLSTDTKGDVMRNYGTIAKEHYGYQVSVIDLRNPTRSNGNNLLHLVNKYMDLYKENPKELVYKARCEKYAKIISKTIILSGMDAASFGQNAYFYDAAEAADCDHPAGSGVLRTGEASHRLRVQNHPGTAGSLTEKRQKSVPTAHGASAG